MRHLDGATGCREVDDSEDVLDSRLDAPQHAHAMPARAAGAESAAVVSQADNAAQDAPQLATDEQFEACTDFYLLSLDLLVPDCVPTELCVTP